MNVLGFVPTLEEGRNASKRAQRIHKENERNNLLAITHLVLNSFLDDAIRGNRMLEADTREISDLLVMLEKVLWHGLKTSAILRSLVYKPEAELWNFLGEVAKGREDMMDAWKSIAALASLSTPTSKMRAFWRLSLMQKHMSVYFQAILDFPRLKDYYEPWALVRDEKCALLGGAFLSLNVFDCNLNIDHDQLQEQLTSFDISPYLKLPTLPGHKPQWSEEYSKEEEQQDLRVILDQKQFLEERNRQLMDNMAILRRGIERRSGCKGEGSTEDLTNGDTDSDNRSLVFTQRLGDLEREREILQIRLSEKDDALRLAQQQLADTKRLSEDLYEKLRSAEGKSKRLGKDLSELKELHSAEMAALQDSLDSFRSSREEEQGHEEGHGSSTILTNELSNKTQQYMEAMASLTTKQQELSRAQESIARLERRCEDLEGKISRLNKVEKELADVKHRYELKEDQLTGCQQALQELGGHLSESKLKMVELKEEMLPLSEAEWINDSAARACKLCEVPFSLSMRRHHCRRCGSIFCATCSHTRVKLPSSAKPVRVCLGCYEIIHNRQQAGARVASTSTSSATAAGEYSGAS